MKVAYCLYGQPRYIEEGAINIINFVKRHPHVKFEFYYHTWFDEDAIKSMQNQIDRRGDTYKLYPEIIKRLTTLYNPVAFIYEKQINFTSNEYEHTLAYKNFDMKENTFIRLSQWYSRCAVRNILFLNVKYKNRNYDLIISSRFDIKKPIDIDLTYLDKSKLYVADFRLPSYIIPDNILVMNQDMYFKLFVSLHNFINSEIVEKRMKKYGLTYNLGMEELVCAAFLYNYKIFKNVVYTPLIGNFI